MLKSYKKVSRWYPALEPVGTDGTAPEPSDAHGGTGFDVPDGPARYPHYIHDDEPEFTIPPVPESVLRRTHFSGAWSDWMTDRESASYTPQLRYRGTTVLEFPWEGAEDGEHATSGRGRPDVASALLDVVGQPDSVKSVSPRQFRRRRLVALLFLIVAILLLAAAGGVALYVLNSHDGTSQSIGTLGGDPRSGPSDRAAAYNEMTATVAIGDHIPTAGIPAG
ncbi:hypothetical protein OHB26_25765 [Nocardia sp. NBC_01503]|uniref:hypothetical protein n=1 Tax=Nocardia sp. NBC_01503 TaxID=2975997 RepID=UPI002E7C30DE|nr:hypothetical protein [Nocardia sp. NBC_01503]WTL30335.1 hypothetical protein OHB26_25765 [Nocardia sp. NBC_01503]